MSTTARKRRVRETHLLNSKSARVKRAKQETIALQPRPQNLPLWAPDPADLSVVPPEVRQAITELLQPFYDQYVVHAPDGMEKSLGITIVHLLWLEILEQFDIKREYIDIEAVLHISHNRPEMIDRHLRLIDSKLRVGYFLLRIKELRTRLATQPQLPSPFPPQSTDPVIIPASHALSQSPNPENPNSQL